MIKVNYSEVFERWWNTLDEEEQKKIAFVVRLLEEKGKSLSLPYSRNKIYEAKNELRELRVQYREQPYRILYAFEPLGTAILLLGGSKKCDDRWYKKHIPKADKIYEEHLENMKQEGKI
ncbi:addiction module toxin RelE [Candidatus Thiomargarita nelsonii]|uniref:Addiction module toxin RelE n=1 Tax=Candidatus Thiomargarita nelsonii TaxID=1003181 RepID=A0A0A6PFS0_9GAMM|nr:addiction module toxin RelE [Candidatus Thiomargarita nelsonii]